MGDRFRLGLYTYLKLPATTKIGHSSSNVFADMCWTYVYIELAPKYRTYANTLTVVEQKVSRRLTFVERPQYFNFQRTPNTDFVHMETVTFPERTSSFRADIVSWMGVLWSKLKLEMSDKRRRTVETSHVPMNNVEIDVVHSEAP